MRPDEKTSLILHRFGLIAEDHARLLAAIQEDPADTEAGRLIPHEEVVAEFMKRRRSR